MLESRSQHWNRDKREQTARRIIKKATTKYYSDGINLSLISSEMSQDSYLFLWDVQKAYSCCQNMQHNILPEKRSHSSPRRFSGIPFCTSSLVLAVRYIHIPLPYSKKWMFQDSSFIFSFAFKGTNMAILGDYFIFMFVGQVIWVYSGLHFTRKIYCDI